MDKEFLDEILLHKQAVNSDKKAYFASLKKTLDQTEYSRYRLFQKMISRLGKINLIAEIKKASPSKGMLREEFDLMAIAKIYVENNAAAISILTEDKYFLGNPLYVKKVSEMFPVPVLVKDFIIDEGQIYEARHNGASAILLIAAILPDDQLKHFFKLAGKLDLDCLVEVHDEQELTRALDAGAEIIGINNRDLRTFVVDIKTCERLIPLIPKGKVIVAESGIQSREDILKLKALGANAVLIGEIFMKEQDIAKKIQEVMNG